MSIETHTLHWLSGASLPNGLPSRRDVKIPEGAGWSQDKEVKMGEMKLQLSVRKFVRAKTEPVIGLCWGWQMVRLRICHLSKAGSRLFIEACVSESERSNDSNLRLLLLHVVAHSPAHTYNLTWSFIAVGLFLICHSCSLGCFTSSMDANEMHQ